ncbi:hypothetical protein ACIPD2_15120 [Streptomyces griseofuscus]|uniref:hypothetical protein n=1 Tax=Streptomyces griseofuscus TaxID=146922 RepID=UPI003820041A
MTVTVKVAAVPPAATVSVKSASRAPGSRAITEAVPVPAVRVREARETVVG